MPSRFIEQISKWGKKLVKSIKQRHDSISFSDQ